MILGTGTKDGAGDEWNESHGEPIEHGFLWQDASR